MGRKVRARPGNARNHASNHIPGDPEELRVRGIVKFKEGKFAEAVEEYSHALISSKAAAWAPAAQAKLYANRSIARLSARDARGALSDAKQAVNLDPTWSKAWYRQGQAESHLEHFQEATAAFDKAASLDPLDATLSEAAAHARRKQNCRNWHWDVEDDSQWSLREKGAEELRKRHEMALQKCSPRQHDARTRFVSRLGPIQLRRHSGATKGLRSAYEACLQDMRTADKQSKDACVDVMTVCLSDLSILYRDGIDGAVDHKRALQFLHEAAELPDQFLGGIQNKESATIFVQLSQAAQEGMGMQIDKQAALNWVRRAAEQGDAVGQNNLAVMLFHAKDAESQREAVVWYRKSADQGYSNALLGLGTAHARGVGVARDIREAVRLWKAAEHVGSFEATNMLIEHFTDEGDSCQAIEHAQRILKRPGLSANRKAEMSAVVGQCLMRQEHEKLLSLPTSQLMDQLNDLGVDFGHISDSTSSLGQAFKIALVDLLEKHMEHTVAMREGLIALEVAALVEPRGFLQAQLTLAEFYLRRQDGADSALKFAFLASQQHHNAKAMKLAGQAHQRLGNIASAQKNFRKASENGDKDAHRLLSMLKSQVQDKTSTAQDMAGMAEAMNDPLKLMQQLKDSLPDDAKPLLDLVKQQIMPKDMFTMATGDSIPESVGQDPEVIFEKLSAHVKKNPDSVTARRYLNGLHWSTMCQNAFMLAMDVEQALGCFFVAVVFDEKALQMAAIPNNKGDFVAPVFAMLHKEATRRLRENPQDVPANVALFFCDRSGDYVKNMKRMRLVVDVLKSGGDKSYAVLLPRFLELLAAAQASINEMAASIKSMEEARELLRMGKGCIPVGPLRPGGSDGFKSMIGYREDATVDAQEVDILYCLGAAHMNAPGKEKELCSYLREFVRRSHPDANRRADALWILASFSMTRGDDPGPDTLKLVDEAEKAEVQKLFVFKDTPHQCPSKTLVKMALAGSRSRPAPRKDEVQVAEIDGESLEHRSLDTCWACGANQGAHKLLKCSGCKVAMYCSGACQKAHWKEHKPRCKQLASSDLPGLAITGSVSSNTDVPSPSENSASAIDSPNPASSDPPSLVTTSSRSSNTGVPSPSEGSAASSGFPKSSGDNALRFGCQVEIHGLTGSVELNGSIGTLQRWDADSGRWIVHLTGTALGLTKSVRPANLRFFSPPAHGQGADTSGNVARPSMVFDSACGNDPGMSHVLFNNRKASVSVAGTPENVHGDAEFIVKLQPPCDGPGPWMCYDKKRSFNCLIPESTLGLPTARRLLEEGGVRSLAATGVRGVKGYFHAKWERKHIHVFIDALAPTQKW